MISSSMRGGIITLALAALAGCGRTKKPPGCEQMAAHVLTLFGPADDHARNVQQVFRDRCERDQWSAAVRICIGTTKALYEPKNCKLQLTDVQRQAFDAALAQADERELSRRIPESCIRYERILEHVMKCDVLPIEARNDLKTKLETSKQGWAAMPNKRALEPMCNAAISAVRQATAECPGASTW
jgi:hypothetical protein